MKNEPSFDHRPDPELGAALRAALEPHDDQSAFVARVMAQYQDALDRASIPALDVLPRGLDQASPLPLRH